VVVDVSLLGVIALLILAAVVVAVGQRGVIVGMRVPRRPVLIIVAEATSVVVADMPMIVAMLGRGVGVLGFLSLALGALPDIAHCGASSWIHGCLDNPA
jgi:hypothetical protein